MRPRPPVRCALAGALVLLPLLATAGGSGTCRYHDKTLVVADAVLYRAADPFDAEQQETKIALASVKLDAARIAAARDPEDALREQVWAAENGGQVQLTLGEGGVTALYAYLPPGSNISRSGSAFGEVEFSRNDDAGIAGRFRLAADGADELSCDLHFDLRYAAPVAQAGSAAAGKALPAGGGEAGKVLQANLAAMRRGDVDGMLATVARAQAEQMRAQRKSADFSDMLAMMRALAPASASVTGGRDYGDRAELDLVGVDADGGKTRGTARMVKEDGRWKVEKTSMSSGGD